jgi:hypothetical protein
LIVYESSEKRYLVRKLGTKKKPISFLRLSSSSGLTDDAEEGSSEEE